MGRFPMQDLCLAVIVLMPLLGSIVCGLRFYAKRRSAGGIGLDDWLIVAAVAFSYIIVYPSWRITKMWYYGVHIWDAPKYFNGPPMKEWYRMSMVFYMFSTFILPLVKASIIVLLLKVGGIIAPVKRAVYILFVVNALIAIVPAFFYLFQCPPLTGNNWEPRTFGGLRCSGLYVVGRVNIFQVCMNMLTDLLIFPIPVYLTWKLQKASFRDRAVIIFLFSLSLGVTAIGAIRIYLTYEARLYKTPEIDWTWSIAFCVNHLEHGMAIIFACVPSLRILILGWLGYHDSDGSGARSRVTYAGSRAYGRPLADEDRSRGSMAFPASPKKAQTKGIEVTCLTTFDVESQTIKDYPYHLEDTPRTHRHDSGEGSSYAGSKSEVDTEEKSPRD